MRRVRERRRLHHGPSNASWRELWRVNSSMFVGWGPGVRYVCVRRDGGAGDSTGCACGYGWAGGADVQRERFARKDTIARAISRQVRGAGVDQPRMPLHEEAIRQRQYAGATAGMDGEGRGVADGAVVRRRASRATWMRRRRMRRSTRCMRIPRRRFWIRAARLDGSTARRRRRTCS